jgi:hypothetical protein
MCIKNLENTHYGLTNMKSQAIKLNTGIGFSPRENELWGRYLVSFKKESGLAEYSDLSEEDQNKVDSLMSALKKNFKKITVVQKMASVPQPYPPLMITPEMRFGIRPISYDEGELVETFVITFKSFMGWWWDFSLKEDAEPDRKESEFQYQELGNYAVWFS